LRRYAQAQKFHKTLPHKLDAEVEKVKETFEEPELNWEFKEVNEFGQEGWTISYSYKDSNESND
jgi:transposase